MISKFGTTPVQDDYAVRDEQDRLVCQGNFETGDVGEPMNPAKAEEFQRMAQGRKAYGISETQTVLKGERQK